MSQEQKPVGYAGARAKAMTEVELLIAELAASLREQVAAHGPSASTVPHGSLALARILAASKGIAPTDAN